MSIETKTLIVIFTLTIIVGIRDALRDLKVKKIKHITEFILCEVFDITKDIGKVDKKVDKLICLMEGEDWDYLFELIKIMKKKLEIGEHYESTENTKMKPKEEIEEWIPENEEAIKDVLWEDV